MTLVHPKPGQNSRWLRCDLEDIFSLENLQKNFKELAENDGVVFTDNKTPPPAYNFPDFGAHKLQTKAINNICSGLSSYLRRSVTPVADIPSVIVAEVMGVVWQRVLQAVKADLVSQTNVKRVMASMEAEVKVESEADVTESTETTDSSESPEKKTGNEVLMEAGVRTGLTVVFTLLKQAWSQLAWQRQIEQSLSLFPTSGNSGSLLPFGGTIGLPPQVSLPNEVLKSILDILKSIPPLALSNQKSLSKLSVSCLQQSTQFLDWIMRPDSQVDYEGKRLASEIALSLVLQQGSLVSLVEWVNKVLSCMEDYTGESEDVARPSLSLDFCDSLLVEIRKRTQLGTHSPEKPVTHQHFEPKDLTAYGHANIIDFLLFLIKELANICQSCTSYFSDQCDRDKTSSDSSGEGFLSETSEVYAFGSNSSSQLAMGSTEKFLKATNMQHMANVQVVHAGQYCSFLIFGDGTVKACGKGSYGRLGLGNSDSQPTLKVVGTFPPNTVLRKIVSSRGSDGHSLAITNDGQVFSWGDGNYGKLGHGDNVTHKVPKLISAFTGKVIRFVSCGNRHSAAVTSDGELYTWGEGDHGRLGHGNTTSQKSPTLVESISGVREVSCGVAHTLALSADGLTVWSFGSGDSGKLGHRDTVKQLSPKVIESFRGMMCQRVCAASQFSLVLTAGGKVYSFGNGSGVGKGTTEPRQYTPWLIEPLVGEMIIDISTGDGHCLALTQRGEVFAWGTNSMGQCGQGHNNGSITAPARVQGLEGLQVQQISAGTSHSIAWTAVPMDRRASAMWHWPYCVSVGEKTFKNLIDLLNKYGDITSETAMQPFTSKDTQESFLHSILTLTRIHISMVAPLGPSCVRMACGNQVKPLRNLLFKFIDSQLPPSLDQVTSDALEVGSSVLLPPIVDRLDLLLSILPAQPSQLTALTTGQRRQLNILLQGFSDRNELVGLIAESIGDHECVPNPQTVKLHVLFGGMIEYLGYSVLSTLRGTPLLPDLKINSPLLKTFEQFIVSVFIVSFSWCGERLGQEMGFQGDGGPTGSYMVHLDHVAEPKVREVLFCHFTPFVDILKDHSLRVIKEFTDLARASDDPLSYFEQNKDILFGFLPYQFPTHICLITTTEETIDMVFSLGDLLLEMAECVHEIVSLFPSEVVTEMERTELLLEPLDVNPCDIDLTKLQRGSDNEPWTRLMDFERLLCRASGKFTKILYTCRPLVYIEFCSSINYSPGVSIEKPTLESSHLLCNGLVGVKQELAEAITTWVSMCKHLPGQDRLEKLHPADLQYSEETICCTVAVPPVHWENYYIDYIMLYRAFRKMYPDSNLLGKGVHDVEPCDMKNLPPLLALAVGSKVNKQAADMYDRMMDMAISKDWNTCSDETAVPQLRQVSYAALACLLKHTGLFTCATNCGSRPKKKLVDVYRSVFFIRREVFTNRPIPDSEGKVSPKDQDKFQTCCNGMCVTLMFLTCVIGAAMPEETDPIVPQIGTSLTTASTSADDVALRSPGSSTHKKQFSTNKPPVRLLSHPEISEVDQETAVLLPEPLPIQHSTSVSPSSGGTTQGWSLPAVKQALSHLRWQRDRLDHLHASSPHGNEGGSPHAEICSTIAESMVEVFFCEENDMGLIDRVQLIHDMLNQQRKAFYRRTALQRMEKFVSRTADPTYILPSSRLAFLSACMDHSIHYSDDITVAPSVLQHEVKNLSHSLVEKMILSLDNNTDLLVQRDHLLALQWSNFSHHPSDLLFLLSNNLNLYSKVVSHSGVVSSCLEDDKSLTSSRLASRLRMACVLMMQMLSIQVGLKSDVLKSSPEILSLVSKHLYGQLEGFVNNEDPDINQRWESRECTVEEREELLGEFLTFVNTLSATHETMRSVLASDRWFEMLLRIVDIDTTTGKPVISSLKTRLLALQALGAIMADHSDSSPEAQAKCYKIIDDLLELMSRCMFLAPLSHFSDKIGHSPPVKTSPEPSVPEPVSIPFTVDPVNQRSCVVTTELDGSVIVEGTGSNGYAMGLTGLIRGKYRWKVSVRSANAAFCVGVGQKPLTDLTVGTSNQFWLFEAHTGRLLHNGESDLLLPAISEGDTITIEYNADDKTLAYATNDGALAVVYPDVVKAGKDLFPVLRFNRRNNTAKICVHPFAEDCQSIVGGTIQEMTSSGYPLLSPIGTTLVQAVVSMLYQVQNKEPWSKALAHVLTNRLSEMDLLIHRLLDLQIEIDTCQEHPESNDDLLTPLSLLFAQFTQVVWPCLAVVGGVDTGFCLGRTCQVEVNNEQINAMIVSLPDGYRKVKVQQQVTTGMAKVKNRSCFLSELKLIPQSGFSLSLIVDRLTPSALLNMAHLAGYLDKKHSLLTIVQSAQDHTKVTLQEMGQCVPYHRLCSSQLQLAATKSLHTILFDESVVKLLTYRPPSLQTVIAGDYEDKSELSNAVKDILKCLSSRAIKPSPLTPTLNLLELERVHSVLGHQSLAAVADYMSQHGQHKQSPPDEPESTPEQTSDQPKPSPPADHETTPTPEQAQPPVPVQDDLTPSSSAEELSQSIPESVGSSSNARAPTPPIVNLLMDMGFSRAHVNVAIDNCEIPPNSGEQSRMQLLVSWIIDHPNAVAEEEARIEEVDDGVTVQEEERLREEQQQLEADRNAAADEFLSMVGEMLEPEDSPTVQEEAEQSTKHAPDLLEGPDVEEEVPDVSLTGLDNSPQSLKSLLSALGLSNKNPTPKRFEFSSPDPLGEHLCKVNHEEGDFSETGKSEGGGNEKGGVVELSHVCENIIEQVNRLKTLDEHLLALDRVAAATQTLVARRVTMLVIASLSTQTPIDLISNLQALGLVDIPSLVRLLRLVDAGRIDGTPGDSFSVVTASSLLPIKGLDCLSSAITTAVTQSLGSGTQLMQSCSRDLLAAAVGGAELLQRAGRRRRQRRNQAHHEGSGGIKSDVSILANPNFSVTRNLVQTLAKSTGQVSLSENCSGMLQIIDALAACLFSSKLIPEHRFWALEQLLKVFSSGAAVGRREVVARDNKEGSLLPSQLEHLVGHKGQIMNCMESKSNTSKKILSIGEDNSVILWNVEDGMCQPDTTTLTLPTPPPGSRDSPSSQPGGLMLPTITQSFNGACVAGAVDESVCVWRTRDGKAVMERFNDLVTTLQWKPIQKEGESALLLVGLVDGGVELVEVLRSSGVSSLPPELHTTKIERWIKGAVCCMSWSPTSGAFAVGSTSSCVQVYVGSTREYSVTAEIKEIQACSLCWSPDESFLTTVEDDGALKLWDVYGETPLIVHSFDAYPTSCVLWHPLISSTGNMLLASGSKDGSVHLWTILGKRPSDLSENEPDLTDQSEQRGVVSHVTCLEGHPAPITSLVFNEEACLLASGCKAGSVRIWDLQTFALLKFVSRSVGEVLNMSWTIQGLAICYNNTCSLCILPPSPQDYLSERCVHSCLPMLQSQGISEPDKAPCLMALLRNLHLVLLDQYNYEEAEMASSQQLVHTEYLQLLTSLAVGLGIHNVFLSPPHPPHTLPTQPSNEWVWLANFTRVLKCADSFSKRSPLPDNSGFNLPPGVDPLPPSEKYQTTDNSVWTFSMDTQILEWLSQQPQDWWRAAKSSVYTWGKGSWNQLGHSTSERATPAVVDDWTDIQQIVAGSYCTYGVKFDGTVCSVGEGSYGRLGHGGSESETKMRAISDLQGIPVVYVVGGPRVSTSTDEGFALALADSGNIYSWGKGYKGRLGHTGTENVRSPKLVEALCGKEVKMIAACDYHCAVITNQGELYTMGSKENGKLGRGRDNPSGSVGLVAKVSRFLDSDEQDQIHDVKIGYVSCGQMFTVAISEDGSHVFAFGKSDHCAFGLRTMTGDHYHPVLLAHLTPYGPFKMAASGHRATALLNEQGKVCFFGALTEGAGHDVEPNYIQFPNDENIVDLAAAAQFIMALSENGNVYYWGKNQFGTDSTAVQTTPKLIEPLVGKGLKQISAAVRHCAASNTTLPVKGVSNIRAPSAVPVQYTALKDAPCTAIHTRMLLLNHFSNLVMGSWKLFHVQSDTVIDSTRFHVNPLSDGNTRSLLSPIAVESLVAAVISRTMTTKQHGPSVNVSRITDDYERKAVFPQLATQILQKPPQEIRCSTRAWKVNLSGEGADDAGGVFDDTVTTICEEMEKGVVKLLIQTPNARNKCGFNTDRFVFDPTCTTAKDLKHLKFVGIVFGVAMRTKKPLHLHLAQPMWKLLAGMTLTAEDLEEIDMIFIQTMYGIRDIHKSGIKEEDFSEMIPIESFEAQSMSGKFVPIVPGGGNIKLTFQNRKEYMEKALQFRLHELDKQIAAVREGMSCIVPVPLLSLYTSKMLERAVCGSEEVDLQMLKKVVRYRDGTTESSPVVTWLWQTLETFTNEDRILFLRFVSGRSRLPVRVSEITQRFQISVQRQVSDNLPTSQTCFFQLRLPTYSSQEVLAERLRYAIRHCRSIDMDTYMLRGGGGDLYDDDTDDDEDYY